MACCYLGMARTTFKIRRIFSLSASYNLCRQSITKLSLCIGSSWFAAQPVGEIFSQKQMPSIMPIILRSTTGNCYNGKITPGCLQE